MGGTITTPCGAIGTPTACPRAGSVSAPTVASSGLVRGATCAILVACSPSCQGDSEVARKNHHAVALGRKGGKVRSEAKTEAARANAKKGGWPKGKKRKTD
jgi:hypothetical protein